MTDRPKSSPAIDRGKWLAALTEVSHVDDQEALTMQEICILLGLQQSATKVRLKKLIANGTALPARKRVVDSSGRQQWIPAYRLVKP